jgi:hypothetical protein
MLIFTEEGKPENPEKNPRSKGENQQQTQLTYDNKFGISNPSHSGERQGALTATPPMLPKPDISISQLIFSLNLFLFNLPIFCNCYDMG